MSGTAAVEERVRPGDLAWFAFAAVVVVATPFGVIAGAGDDAVYRDERGLWREAPVEVGLPLLALLLLVWPGLKAVNLVRGAVAVRLDRDGVRLYREVGTGTHLRQEAPRVAAPWDEVSRLVLWRRPERAFGFVPVRRDYVALERTDAWHEIARREPTPGERRSTRRRRNGVPVRLGNMTLARSVRLSARAGDRLASQVAVFDARVVVVDETDLERPRVLGR